MNARSIPPAVHQVPLCCSLRKVPHPVLAGGTPSSPGRGTPYPDLGSDLNVGGGTLSPHPDLRPDMDGVPPEKGHGTSGWKYFEMEMRYALRKQIDTYENSTFPILQMRAVIMGLISLYELSAIDYRVLNSNQFPRLLLSINGSRHF